MVRGNQHKPLPPPEVLDTLIVPLRREWMMRKTDQEILDVLVTLIDTDKYGFGLTKFKEWRTKNGFLTTRQQGHTMDTIHEPISELRIRFPMAGAREMVNLLFHEKNMMAVSRNVVIAWQKAHEPERVRQRRQNRLKRRRFWAAGVNDMIAVDQHDKWLRFGLALHTGIDPFSGKIHWMKIWWTNSNPKIVTSYYLDFVRKDMCIPLVTQSDLGSENYGMARAQTTLRHLHDPSLAGTVQHRWMRHKKNVKPEITWSQLRRRFTPGFEDILESGVTNGWYDITRPIDMYAFRWIFIPYLQRELDTYVTRVNNTRKRRDRNKILPHGAPNDIHSDPNRYGCLDFKIQVTPEQVDYVQQLYAPPDDSVFELVPPAFAQSAELLFAQMGRPVVTFQNVWAVYRDLVTRFEHMADSEDVLDECQLHSELLSDEEQVTAPEGIELQRGEEGTEAGQYYYMGGVNNGLGLDKSMIANLEDIEISADFTDEEDAADDDMDDWSL